MLAAEAQLARWQRRELLYRLVTGVSYTLLVVLTLLAAACVTDWAIDRSQETPFALRALMTGVQLAVALVAVTFWVARVRAPAIDELAAKAEELVPAFGHRLVTALQLARDPAKSADVSRAMLHQVAFEAEALAERHPLAKFADGSRASLAVGCLLPALLAWVVMAVLNGPLAGTLLQRQLLQSVDIPRPVTLENRTPGVVPAGQPARIEVVATGRLGRDIVAELTVTPEGEPTETLAMQVERLSDSEAILRAEWPTATPRLTFTVTGGGSRLLTPGLIEFVARPSVTAVEAEVILPGYLDPEGTRTFRRTMPQGEIVTVRDSQAVVSAEFSKPVASAVMRFIKRDEAGREAELSATEFTLNDARTSGSATAPIPSGATGYRVSAADEYGFTTEYPPLRLVTVLPDRPPEVSLLPEVLKDPKDDGPLEDYLVDGMPLRLGGQVQVGFAAKSPLGIDRAYVVYRVNEGEWSPLPLKPVTPDPEKTGPFVPELGVFRESGVTGQVELYLRPADDPDAEPGGLEAGGRMNFQTSALRKRLKSGEEVPLEVGDLVEVRVAVYDRHPDPARPATLPPAISADDARVVTDARRPAGWSAESRLKQVVSDARFEEWRREHYRTRVKLAELEQKQRDVFRRGE